MGNSTASGADKIVALVPGQAFGLEQDLAERLLGAFEIEAERESLADSTFSLIELVGRFEDAAETDAHQAALIAVVLADLAIDLGAEALFRAAGAAADGQAGQDPVARAATAHRLVRTAEGVIEAMLQVTMAPRD